MKQSDTNNVRLMIADDQTLVRIAAADLMETHPGIEVVAQVSSSNEVLPVFLDVKPDVVLLDIAFGRDAMSGLACAVQLLEAAPEARIVFLSSYDQPSIVRRAYRLGAKAFLTKVTEDTQLVRAIRHAAAGERYYDQELMANVGVDSVTGERDSFESLDETKKKIFLQLAKQRTYDDIAKDLGCAVRTVATLAPQVRSILNIREPVDATLLAIRLGMIDEYGNERVE